ncbi:MAG TPA: hypothetical protein VJ905_04285 [Halalkalibaculum sp.]|nr:hypothetical protein [Halalkalibaculum sp.]
MLRKLILLNWSSFLSRLSKFQTVLVIGYIIFLLILFSNLLGSALVIVLFDKNPMVLKELPWLTPQIHYLILLVFANILWILHFSFTSTRLLNMEENRKLLSFGYPVNKLAWHLNLIGFFHPLNIIYNFTWTAFLLLQIKHVMYIPVVIIVVLLNYAIIYSFKHRFLKIVEKRFKLIVFSTIFILFGTFQAIAIISRQSTRVLSSYLPSLASINGFLEYLPGGLLLSSATKDYNLATASAIYGFCALLVFLIFRDHFFKTKEGLQSPVNQKLKKQKNRLWLFLRKWLGVNAGKFYYYVISHPYNRLQALTILLIPAIYVPLLLYIENNYLSAILIPTMLAAIPVALLAMGMANMYGYEHREFLLHKQFPLSFEKQLKERFLGIITVPLFIFYLITIGEIVFLPQLGTVFGIYIANTFFFLCFMIVFLWSSFYYFQKASYTSFSFKHPIVSQKVTFMMTFLIFGLGYTIFVPLGDYETYRLWVMSALIGAIVIYLWQNMEVLVNAFNNKILMQIWKEN